MRADGWVRGGASGRAAEGLELVAAVDAGDDRTAVESAEVVVDFTHPDAVMGNIAWCTERGINVVVGTTGFTAERLDRVPRTGRPAATSTVAINFSIGAVLMTASL